MAAMKDFFQVIAGGLLLVEVNGKVTFLHQGHSGHSGVAITFGKNSPNFSHAASAENLNLVEDHWTVLALFL